MNEPSDYELVTRALKNDPRAFDLLYLRYAPAIGRRLRRLVFQDEDAEDLMQATFFEAHNGLARFRADASFEGWLYAIAFRLVGNYIKASKRKWWHISTPGPTVDDTAVGGTAVDDQAASRQRISKLYRLLDELTPPKRIAFVLHEFEGLDLTEIGRLMGATPQTTWARVESARKTLREKLGDDDGPKGLGT